MKISIQHIGDMGDFLSYYRRALNMAGLPSRHPAIMEDIQAFSPKILTVTGSTRFKSALLFPVKPTSRKFSISVPTKTDQNFLKIQEMGERGRFFGEVECLVQLFNGDLCQFKLPNIYNLRIHERDDENNYTHLVKAISQNIRNGVIETKIGWYDILTRLYSSKHPTPYNMSELFFQGRESFSQTTKDFLDVFSTFETTINIEDDEYVIIQGVISTEGSLKFTTELCAYDDADIIRHILSRDLPPGHIYSAGKSILHLPRDKAEFVHEFFRENAFELYHKSYSASIDKAKEVFLHAANYPLMESVIKNKAQDVIKVYNWLQSHGDVRRQIIRRQAWEAYPFLIEEAITDGNSSPTIHYKNENSPIYEADKQSILQAIDEEKALEPALMKGFGLSRAIVRSLYNVKGKMSNDTTILSAISWTPIQAIGELSVIHHHLPPSHYPVENPSLGKEEQWHGFFHVLVTYYDLFQDRFIKTNQSPEGLDATLLFQKEKPIWKTKDASFIPIAYEGQVMDVMKYFNKQLLFPAYWDCLKEMNLTDCMKPQNIINNLRFGYKVASPLGLIFFRNHNLRSLKKVVDYWHDNIKEMNVRAYSDERWPALTPEQVIKWNGRTLHIVPLISPQDLVEEGKRMNHCVGTYMNKCLYESSHVFSIRNENGESLSTFEFIQDNDEEKIVLNQHYAKGNTEVSEELSRIVNLFLQDLNNKTIPMDLPHLMREQEDRINKRSCLEEYSEYDARNESLRDVALKFWSFALPVEERGMDYRTWVEHLNLREIIMNDIEMTFLHLINKTTLSP